MSIKAIMEVMTPGGFVSIIVILSLLIQITPLKLNPWTWLGDQLNVNLSKRIDKVEKDLTHLDDKLNSHVVESYRNAILEFADSVMHGKLFTHDKWRQMLKMCNAYETMIHEEGLINGDATEAIEFIRQKYQKCANTGEFSDFKKA